MENRISFVKFLRLNKNGDEVSSALAAGIEHEEFPGTEDSDNLFAVSQHFMKNGNGDPQQILESLVIAYHRWILLSMQGMTKSLERCISANRVVFIEENTQKGQEVPMWRDLNQALANIAGTIQDFGVASNYLLMADKVSKTQG